MVVLFDTNYTHPTVYMDFCYQKSITAEYHRSLLRPVYGWFAGIIAQLDHYFNRSFCEYKPLDKLEFGGESPLTIRARCSAFRYCPDPLGIVSAEQFDKLEFAAPST